MKFEIGDTVLLLHSGEEGIIVEELNKEMVKVDVNGVIFPVYIDQIDFPYFKNFTENKSAAKKQKIIPGEFLPVEKTKPVKRKENGVSLSFLPEYDHSVPDPLIQTLKIYLINETSVNYHFDYSLLLNNHLGLEVRNDLHAFTNFYLQDLPFESLNDHPKFEFIFSLQQPDEKKETGYSVILKPKARQFIRRVHDMENRREATFSYLLFKNYPDKIPEPEEKWDLPSFNGKIRFTKQVNEPFQLPQYEVDLHIEKLTDQYNHLTPADMLAIQLGEFQRQLDIAIAKHQYSLIVIHGIGKGTLRNEIHEMLRHTPEVKSFVNQYDARYGYGATEIFFEYH
ncbi:MAG: hypothetical protein EPN39_10840 [Chitinophagaceae bacterium]|jgi:hypothetical protein|nr:MAG: hypothetical protein EPN39_10840 [Chitinophagaceae bacterium]